MFEAVIFDMDGVLIDSEPFWKSAEKEVFGALGIEVTDENTCKTSLMTTRQVTEYWFAHKSWKNISLEEVEQRVIEKVGELIEQNGTIMPGVEMTLRHFRESGYKIGLATNSPDVLISKVLQKLNIEQYFHVTLSSDFVSKGKPSPDIYLKTAAVLNVAPSKCLVFEDSKSGVKAALAAGMSVIAVPEKKQYDDIEFQTARMKIRSLMHFYQSRNQILHAENN